MITINVYIFSIAYYIVYGILYNKTLSRTNKKQTYYTPAIIMSIGLSNVNIYNIIYEYNYYIITNIICQ